MTSTSNFPSTALTTLLVLVSVGLSTILPLPLILIYGLVMIGFGPPILVTDSTFVD
ncbi:hypothetical protein A2U01_0109017, partial [Trifolium medium]|nr:hypothetical protein [Trifolium medium]